MRFPLGLLGAVAVILPLTVPPALADGTTVTVSGITAGASTLSITGSVAYATDATGAYVVGTDATGDASGLPGMDLTSISVRTDVAAKRLIWTLGIGNGLPDPVGGPAPAAMGYQVPIIADGENWWRWLGAGTAGSGNAQPGKWTALCHNETATGAQGGWSCPGSVFGSAATYALTGAISATGVSWTQGFTQMKPAIQYGSVVEQGSILCGRPCSMLFPVGLATGGLVQIDTIDSMEGYKVPGEVTLTVTPAGLTPAPDAFTTKGVFNGTTGAFTGSLPKPASAGAYTVWAQTCFGKSESQTCVVGSQDITI